MRGNLGGAQTFPAGGLGVREAACLHREPRRLNVKGWRTHKARWLDSATHLFLGVY